MKEKKDKEGPSPNKMIKTTLSSLSKGQWLIEKEKKEIFRRAPFLLLQRSHSADGKGRVDKEKEKEKEKDGFSLINKLQMAPLLYLSSNLPSFEYLEYAYKGQWYNPVEWIAFTLESMHHHLDISYPSTIILYTILMRTAVIPLQINQLKTNYRQTIYRPTVQSNTSQIMRLREQGRTEEALKKLQEAKEFLKEKGITPFKALALAIIPIPIYISTFLALRNMASQSMTSMMAAGEGFGWITNLTLSDPYFILPITTTALMMATMEVLFSNHHHRYCYYH